MLRMRVFLSYMIIFRKNGPHSLYEKSLVVLLLLTRNMYPFLLHSRADHFSFSAPVFCPTCPHALLLAPAGGRNGMRIYAGNPRNSLATNRPETAGSCSPEISKRCFTRRPTYPGFPFFVEGNNNFIPRSAFIPHNFLRAHVRSAN